MRGEFVERERARGGWSFVSLARAPVPLNSTPIHSRRRALLYIYFNDDCEYCMCTPRRSRLRRARAEQRHPGESPSRHSSARGSPCRRRRRRRISVNLQTQTPYAYSSLPTLTSARTNRTPYVKTMRFSRLKRSLRQPSPRAWIASSSRATCSISTSPVERR